MKVRTMFAGVAVMAALAAPASASPDSKHGYNNGDEGLIAWVYDTVGGQTNGTVEAHCEYYQQTAPNTNDVTLIVEGHAHVLPRGTVRAVATAVRCQLRNIFTNTIAFDERDAIEGSNGLWVPPKTKASKAASFEVCGAVQVTWQDTTITGDLDDLVCQPVA